MNKVIVIIVLLVHGLSSAGQNNDPEIQNGEVYDKNYVIPFLDSLHQINDYVLVFGISSPFPRTINLCILTKKNNSISVFTNSRREYLKQINLSMDTLTLLWKAYVDNDIFKIKNSKDIKDNCDRNKYMVEDGHSYDFTLLTKNKMKKLSYYMPEYFEQYCPGIVERQRIIAVATILTGILMRK